MLILRASGLGPGLEGRVLRGKLVELKGVEARWFGSGKGFA